MTQELDDVILILSTAKVLLRDHYAEINNGFGLLPRIAEVTGLPRNLVAKTIHAYIKIVKHDPHPPTTTPSQSP